MIISFPSPLMEFEVTRPVPRDRLTQYAHIVGHRPPLFVSPVDLKPEDHVPALGATVADALLETHRSYLPLVGPLFDGGRIKAMAHITGGGITDNLPRALPPGTGARVDVGAWEPPPLFRWLQQSGDVPWDDMLRTFNMGIGLIVVVAPEDADAMAPALGARVIGAIEESDTAAVRYVGARHP